MAKGMALAGLAGRPAEAARPAAAAEVGLGVAAAGALADCVVASLLARGQEVEVMAPLGAGNLGMAV
jgi:hypothetical protein